MALRIFESESDMDVCAEGAAASKKRSVDAAIGQSNAGTTHRIASAEKEDRVVA